MTIPDKLIMLQLLQLSISITRKDIGVMIELVEKLEHSVDGLKELL